MERHSLLYIGPDLLTVQDIDTLAKSNWQVCFAESLGDAETLLRSRPFALGLVGLGHSVKGHLPADWKPFLGRTNLEWIALVGPGCLDDEPTVNLIRDTCCDYHTLPVDCGRLITILGHLDGMAKLRRLELQPKSDWPGQQGMVDKHQTAHPIMMSLKAARDAAEFDAIREAVESTHRNISAAANKLSVTRATLYRLLEKHGFQPASPSRQEPDADWPRQNANRH